MSKIILTTTGLGPNPLILEDLGSITITHPSTVVISNFFEIDEIVRSTDLQIVVDSNWGILTDDESNVISGTLSLALDYVLEIDKNKPKWNAKSLKGVEIDDTNIGLTSSQVISYNSNTNTVEYITLNYVHTQYSASTTWNITHSLNRFPSVTVVDSGGSHVFGDVNYISSNQINIIFTAPFSGKAYLT